MNQTEQLKFKEIPSKYIDVKIDDRLELIKVLFEANKHLSIYANTSMLKEDLEIIFQLITNDDCFIEYKQSPGRRLNQHEYNYVNTHYQHLASGYKLKYIKGLIDMPYNMYTLEIIEIFQDIIIDLKRSLILSYLIDDVNFETLKEHCLKFNPNDIKECKNKLIPALYNNVVNFNLAFNENNDLFEIVSVDSEFKSINPLTKGQTYTEIIVEFEKSINLMNNIRKLKDKNKIINEAEKETGTYLGMKREDILLAFKDNKKSNRFYNAKNNILNLMKDLESEEEIEKCKFIIQHMKIIEDSLTIIEF